VRHALDENLNTVYTTDYSAYGETFNSTGANPMEYGFTGQPLDANGLAYHRARYYVASIGVWNSQDPLELMNRYGYVDGNPIKFTDASGLDGICPFGKNESTGRCNGHEITDAINDAIPTEEIADVALTFMDFHSDILELQTYGLIDEDTYRIGASHVIGALDDIVNFVEDHPVELTIGTLLAGGAIWAAAPAGSLGAITAGGSILTTLQQGAVVGASTNLIGGLLTGRYVNADSTEEAIGKILFDTVIGGAAGAVISKIPTLDDLTLAAADEVLALRNMNLGAGQTIKASNFSLLSANSSVSQAANTTVAIIKYGPRIFRAVVTGGVSTVQGTVSRLGDKFIFGDNGPETLSGWAQMAAVDFVFNAGLSYALDTRAIRHVSQQPNANRPHLNIHSRVRKPGFAYRQLEDFKDNSVVFNRLVTEYQRGLTQEEIGVITNSNIVVPLLPKALEKLSNIAGTCIPK